jgi:hypothetical protein
MSDSLLAPQSSLKMAAGPVSETWSFFEHETMSNFQRQRDTKFQISAAT